MNKFTFILITLIAFSCFGYSQSKNFIDQPFIDVTGHANTSVIPNEIFIKIIISERDTKNKVSVEEMESRMVDSLATLGINTEKDLETNDLDYGVMGTFLIPNSAYYFTGCKDGNLYLLNKE